jgi:homocysteine S-methyltransferase
MSRFRHALPQIHGDLFLADGGIETDLIFNGGIEIREFAAHTLLPDTAGRRALEAYFRSFLRLAEELGAGFILDSQTWKAHPHWADDLDASEDELRRANEDSIAFISTLRDEFPSNEKPIVLNAIIGPRGDAYEPSSDIAAHEAECYHSQQIGWLAETEADMVTATTFTQAGEAVGFVRAAVAADMPVVVSFTVETDGSLPTGQPLGDAIRQVDEETDSAAEYFVVNCAHPDHFFGVLRDAPWARRLRGLRCNASRMSHAELDEAEELDDGNPAEMAAQYLEIRRRLPWLNIFGGCCGTDLRHIAAIGRALTVDS